MCFSAGDGDDILGFLFINSVGREDDLVLNNADVPCLPPNPSGQTCIGLSMIIRVPNRKLHLYQPALLGRLEPQVAARLVEAVRASRTLTAAEKRAVLAGLGAGPD